MYYTIYDVEIDDVSDWWIWLCLDMKHPVDVT